jgi:sRNA-binding regulator protein Hfq
VNRKLIRPNINEVKEKDKEKDNKSSPKNKKKPAPQDTTKAEVYYYLKQMNNKTPMVIVLKDGEILRGFIEWYDKNCIKLNRVDEANLLIFKHNIKYMYKDYSKME